MATILRGNRKGKKAKLLQWCNDWFSIEVDGTPAIVGPTSLKLGPKEIEKVQRSFVVLHPRRGPAAGVMPLMYDLRDDGTFKKVKR